MFTGTAKHVSVEDATSASLSLVYSSDKEFSSIRSALLNDRIV
jgi:hypothetical protein